MENGEERREKRGERREKRYGEDVGREGEKGDSKVENSEIWKCN